MTTQGSAETRAQVIERLIACEQALFDMQAAPDCWCVGGYDNGEPHSEACMQARRYIATHRTPAADDKPLTAPDAREEQTAENAEYELRLSVLRDEGVEARERIMTLELENQRLRRLPASAPQTAIREALAQMARDWREQAERTRLRKGQMTREQAGHEVLANCAYAIEDMLNALAAPAPTTTEPPSAPTVECPECHGQGWIEGTGYEHAPSCDGNCTECPVPVPVQLGCEFCGGGGEVAAPQPAPKTCAWHAEDNDDGAVWVTACGETFEFSNDGPTENGFRYCYACGKSIALQPRAETR